MHYFYKTQEVRDLIGDQWWSVLYALAPELSEALAKPGKHTTYPVHGSRKPKGDGFRLFKDSYRTGAGVCNTCGIYTNGFNLLMWLKGWSFADCLIALGDYVQAPQYLIKNHAFVKTTKQIKKTIPFGVEIAKSTQWLTQQKNLQKQVINQSAYKQALLQQYHRLWSQCLSVQSSGASKLWHYLSARGIKLAPHVLRTTDSVRYHPALAYYNETFELEGYLGAIVLAVRNVQGELVTLHRIYLDSNPSSTSLRTAKAKKMMPIPADLTVKGCAIPLYTDAKQGYLNIAEGVETALAVLSATGLPTWSTLNATLMPTVCVPDYVHTVFIWADRDASNVGQKAAFLLKKRLKQQGCQVKVLLPEEERYKNKKNVDWNDVLQEQGVAGIKRVIKHTCLLHSIVCIH